MQRLGIPSNRVVHHETEKITEQLNMMITIDKRRQTTAVLIGDDTLTALNAAREAALKLWPNVLVVSMGQTRNEASEGHVAMRLATRGKDFTIWDVVIDAWKAKAEPKAPTLALIESVPISSAGEVPPTTFEKAIA